MYVQYVTFADLLQNEYYYYTLLVSSCSLNSINTESNHRRSSFKLCRYDGNKN